MREEFNKILSELVGCPVDIDFNKSFKDGGINNQLIIGLMLCRRLDQLIQLLGGADESIAAELLKCQADKKWMEGMF